MLRVTSVLRMSVTVTVARGDTLSRSNGRRARLQALANLQTPASTFTSSLRVFAMVCAFTRAGSCNLTGISAHSLTLILHVPQVPMAPSRDPLARR